MVKRRLWLRDVCGLETFIVKRRLWLRDVYGLETFMVKRRLWLNLIVRPKNIREQVDNIQIIIHRSHYKTAIIVPL